jgi:hypothetical protein
MKTCKLHITKFIAGEPLLTNEDRVSLDKDGFPSQLNLLKDLISKSYKTGNWNYIRAVLSLLSFTRFLNLKGKFRALLKPDYSTIIKPYSGSKKKYYIPVWFIKDFIKFYEFQVKYPKDMLKVHYISSKGSPTGPATMTSLIALRNYSEEMLRHMFTFLSPINIGQIMRIYTMLEENGQFILEKLGLSKYLKRVNFGKLALVHDPEFKVRIIAMVDYYTQWILKPIHSDLLRFLNKIPMDRTFTQDPRHSWDLSNNEKFHSLDLSAATDRFPIFLQERLIKYLYGVEKAKSWVYLLTNRSYATPEGDLLKYSVGQPMGAYSSWAAFTLTHHLVVQWAAHLNGFSVGTFQQYIILGDDIVIKHNKVAETYVKLMTKWGVGISGPKTHTSSDVYEFAKRWFKGNVELSGIPLKGILGNLNNILIVLSNIFTYIHKMKILPIQGNVLELVGVLYGGLTIDNRTRSINQVKTFANTFWVMLRFAHKYITYDELRVYLINNLSKGDKYSNIPCLPGYEGMASFMKGLLSLGINSQVESSIRTVKRLVDPINLLTIENLDILQKYDYDNHILPLYQGVFNTIDKHRKIIDEINEEKSNSLDFIDIIDALVLIDTDKIVSMHRKAKEKLLIMDKAWKQSFKTITSDSFLPNLTFMPFGLGKTELFTNSYKVSRDLSFALDVRRDHFRIGARPMSVRELREQKAPWLNMGMPMPGKAAFSQPSPYYHFNDKGVLVWNGSSEMTWDDILKDLV